ncbi:hypothetical protein [Actinacidiphila bryophytorum]|uniref:hypothetical protein n=1 Tax=Actinacidiphila bryophytorum TaxID=1436133 RepID=UPI002176A2D2|nr:hypothetical protein [Actinacidiphila bryophytorum]UWE08217.1 hypothetical protein NYE86_05395 [Actinacidiphila bryophytorum]
MEGELLDAEDYASVLRAVQLLSGRHRRDMTLNARMDAWAEFVADVEEGFDTMWAWEFEHDMVHRDWLHDAWPILTERVRRLRQPELDALDERFRLATAPVPSSGMSAGATSSPARWWRSRYPRLVTGDPTAELPATWSPAPTYIG